MATRTLEERKAVLKNAVRFFYDLQKLRQQSSARASKKAAEAEALLDEEDKKFLASVGGDLQGLEKLALKEVKRLLKGLPVYDEFLSKVRGVGPTLAGVLISEFNIERCETVSQMWAWAGLAVRDGKADRRVKGQKAKFNPWLKAKMLKVLGDCLIKSKSPYKKFYDDYKHRKQNTTVDTCMLCEGKGVMQVEAEGDEKKEKKPKPCWNCGGTGGPAPWGRGDAHRHQAAIRYMVKQLLKDFWKAWRALEGLPIRPDYAEEYLGKVHHGDRDPELPALPAAKAA